MPFCDGCGREVDDSHIRERIERLELATQFRPIHIQVLLMDAAPPARPQDYFYRAASDRSERSAASREYFDELAKCVSSAPTGQIGEETALAEFQRCGFFLAHAVECPVKSSEELSAALSRMGPTVVKRVERSYKPKYIVPISEAMKQLISLFEQNGLAERLVLDEGEPFLEARHGQTEVKSSLSDRLTKALAHKP